MRKLIRWLSGPLDANRYIQLKAGKIHDDQHGCGSSRRLKRWRPVVPPGHVPVLVGEEMEWFAVAAELLGHPAFIDLLRRSAEEYGYQQSGVLRIPCSVPLFCRLLRSLSGEYPGDAAVCGFKIG